ncbi:hypothetical protein BJ138DRAFT_1017975, partial [Hygrophoropsis aurantiaca]
FGWTYDPAFTSYGTKRRLTRRPFHQGFRTEASLTFRPMRVISCSPTSPQNFATHHHPTPDSR